LRYTWLSLKEMINKNHRLLSDLVILIRGAGDLASGVAARLYGSNFRKIILSEIHQPLAVRRCVSFSEAVYDKTTTVEGITAVLVSEISDIYGAWRQEKMPVLVDPDGVLTKTIQPDVVVDAIMAKKNTGTRLQDAKLVIALGPGFEAGKDAHIVIETNRGHNLGKLIHSGNAEPDTGIPGAVEYYKTERVLRAGADGVFKTNRKIGDRVIMGEIVGTVGESRVKAGISGIIRGLIRPEREVTESLKIGDIDPRGIPEFCYSISEKARAIGGAVLEAILQVYNKG
jgi:xanthine dehydrogenase accessory factor